jgi:OOP family OmpA-OmpF porin
MSMNPALWSYTATLVATLMTTAPSEAAAVGSKAKAAPTHGTTLQPCTGAPGADPSTDDEAEPWIRRFAPRRKQVELGVHTGLLLLSRQHELYQANLAAPDGGYQPLARGAATVGGRLSTTRRGWLAFEAEGGAALTRTASGARATVWHASGSVVGQVTRWSVVPFVLVGVGALAISSKAPGGVGRDVDAALYVGGGVKVNVSQRFMVRLDVRDIVAARRGVDNGVAHNRAVLVGAAVRMGRQSER